MRGAGRAWTRRGGARLTVLLFALLWAGPAWAHGAVSRSEPLILQLKWTHGFQFAGYYLALERGYYRAAGLDVRFVEGGGAVSPIEEVEAGRAQYGIASSALVLARHEGHEVVALAAIYQHSPLVLLARGDLQGGTVRDLIGRAVMLEPMADELTAYLLREGVPLSQVRVVPHSGDPRDLAEGRVDAMSAYVHQEPRVLDALGFAYRVFDPSSAGIDFYGDVLFTTTRELGQHPERAAAFRTASLRGWVEALADPRAAVALIHARYAPELSEAYLMAEARATADLVRADLIPVGTMYEERWRRIADTYAELGLLPPDASLEGLLFRELPPATVGSAVKFAVVAAVFAGMVAGGLFVFAFWRRRARRTWRAAGLADTDVRLRALTASATAGIGILRGTELLDVNPALAGLLGRTREALVGRDLLAFVHPGHRWRVADLLRGKKVDASEPALEVAFEARVGGTRWCELAGRPVVIPGGEAWVLTVFDVTERKETEQRARFMAHHDPLTGLPNRAILEDRLQVAVAQAHREGTAFALLFVDLDGFKPVNDRLGHRVGDALLQAVAARMRSTLRASDTVARVGGDEFVALVRGPESAARARTVAAKLLDAVRQPVDAAGETVSVTASVGVALFPKHGGAVVPLMEAADAAMYAAKRAGGNAARMAEDGAIDGGAGA